jgi:copper homeostasis protein
MTTFLFELCVETMQAARAAERGGADRIELCSRLDVGGVTPGERLTEAAIRSLSIPVHVLIRPRPGGFAYTAGEFAQMRQQVQWVKEHGAAGELVELALPMKATFHRAFDETPELAEGLEAVIETGADCLLTSGGAPDVLAGAESLKNLTRQAGNRIQILAGGGLKLASLAEILERTGVSCLHGSLTRRAGEHLAAGGNGHTAAGEADILEADVRTAVRLLHNYFSTAKI